MSEDVSSTIDVQVKDYAAHIKPEDIPHTVGNWNGYQVPFLFASNGRAYLEQLRTKSGIWFLDVREQEVRCFAIIMLYGLLFNRGPSPSSIDSSRV